MQGLCTSNRQVRVAEYHMIGVPEYLVHGGKELLKNEKLTNIVPVLAMSYIHRDIYK